MTLRNRIPPPVVVAIFAGLLMLSTMWIAPFNFPGQEIATIILICAGFAISIAAMFQFKKEETTIDPRNPERASSLVTAGIFKYTRNPMYLGLLLSLIGIGIFFGAWASIVLVPLFMVYLNEFQIKPEEDVMRAHFGEEFETYCQNVRRWFSMDVM